jgi:hypothetical protein
MRILFLLFCINLGAEDLILQWNKSDIPNVTYNIRWGPNIRQTYFYTNYCGTNLCGTIKISVVTNIFITVKAIKATLPLPTEYDVPLYYNSLDYSWTDCGLAIWTPLNNTIEGSSDLIFWHKIATVGIPDIVPHFRIGIKADLNNPYSFYRTYQ